MTVCAVIKKSTNVVTNMIVCESHDQAPIGFFLVADPPPWVTIGTKWNGTSFVEPPLPKATGTKAKTPLATGTKAKMGMI